MPLAKYITEFLALDEAIACKGVRDECYTPKALAAFLKHDKRPAVRDQIDAKINQTEMHLPVETSNVPSMEHLAVMINDDHAVYQQLEQQAAHRSVRIGLSLERAKILAPVGTFEDWCKDNLTVSKTHRWRCRKLAGEFLKQLPPHEHEQFSEWIGGAIEDLMMDATVMEFIGDKTQLELFDEYGIGAPKAEAKQLPPPKPKPLEPGETQAHRDATELVFPMMTQIQEYVIGDRRVVQHFNLKELETLQGDLIDAKRIVDDLIKAG